MLFLSVIWEEWARKRTLKWCLLSLGKHCVLAMLLLSQVREITRRGDGPEPWPGSPQQRDITGKQTALTFFTVSLLGGLFFFLLKQCSIIFSFDSQFPWEIFSSMWDCQGHWNYVVKGDANLHRPNSFNDLDNPNHIFNNCFNHELILCSYMLVLWLFIFS